MSNRRELTRYVLVPYPVTTMDKVHCSNNCEQQSCDGETCHLFDTKLSWDLREQLHGYLRCRACLEAETRRRKGRVAS